MCEKTFHHEELSFSICQSNFDTHKKRRVINVKKVFLCSISLIFLILSLSLENANTYLLEDTQNKGSLQAVEEYEKEKLAKMRKHIGRRLLTVRTHNPVEFYESPDHLDRRLKIKKEKEGFMIVGVVQNRSGTMNFYQVKFDSGEMGYLSADAYYLEIKIKEGSLIPVSRKKGIKGEGLSQSKVRESQAIELVKNMRIRVDPVTGEMGSLEKRMFYEKKRISPHLKWRYEVRKIERDFYRVTQYVWERKEPPLIRTWIVDLSNKEVRPENIGAKEICQ